MVMYLDDIARSQVSQHPAGTSTTQQAHVSALHHTNCHIATAATEAAAAYALPIFAGMYSRRITYAL